MLKSKESDYRIMAIFFIASLGIVLLYYLSDLSIIALYGMEMSGGLLHPSLLLNALLILFTVYGLLIAKEKFHPKDFGLITQKLPTALIACVITWCFIQIFGGIASYISTGFIEIDPRWNTDGIELVGLLVGMLFGTALYEEIGYRGFLLVQLNMKMENKTNNRMLQIVLALIVSQVLFTLLHVPWKILNQGWTTEVFLELLFSVFMNGIIYSLLYLRTENIFFVMFVHALGNAPMLLFISYLDSSIILLLVAFVWGIVWPSIPKISKITTSHEIDAFELEVLLKKGDR